VESAKDKYRDPIHGFISVSALENKIIDSFPFQRLRNIKQLAMTYLVFHGAEHTRFGHSLGVMHLVTRAYKSAVSNGGIAFSEEKKEWHLQLLRLIALTHDLGHAPYSHGSESLFPSGLEHENYTERIIKETEISSYILEIGKQFSDTYGADYDITPDIVCDIYSGKNPGTNSEFTFLKSFMDSELDCDKMDYLLRDSLYCGVNYGNFDIERLISCLTVHMQDGVTPRLAIKNGGIQSFEEFVLARYFMFVQVYFHRTRRYFDIMLVRALKRVIPGGMYPQTLTDYLSWDDCKAMEEFKLHQEDIEECKCLVNRIVYTRVIETKTHPESGDKIEFRLVRRELYEKFKQENFIEDHSAAKMPHKIPMRTEVTDEKAIVIVNRSSGKITTISEESPIIKSLTDKIDIQRLYVRPALANSVTEEIRKIYSEIRN